MLPVIQPHYSQAVFLAVLLGVIARNALADRFWCRYLCPLGALLGLLAKIAVLRPVVREAAPVRPLRRVCRLGAVEPAGARAGRPRAARDPQPYRSECTMCLDCLVACPTAAAMGYGAHPRPGPWAGLRPGPQAVRHGAGGRHRRRRPAGHGRMAPSRDRA